MSARRRDALRRAEEFGVDLSLLRELLALTPTERLERHQRALELVLEVREAGRRQRAETERARRGAG
jgi:hypothetical protein